MSSLLTPKRRDRVKQKSATTPRTAQSMSPGIRRSSSLSSGGSGSQSNSTSSYGNNGSNNNGSTASGGTGRISMRDARNNYNNKYHAMNDDSSPPNSTNSSPTRNIAIRSRHSIHTTTPTSTSNSSGSMPPRTVTPTGGLASVSRTSSWEDYEQGVYNMSSSSSLSSNHNHNNNNAAKPKTKAPLSPGRIASAFRQRPVSFSRAFGGGAPPLATPVSPTENSVKSLNAAVMPTKSRRTTLSMRSERTSLPYLNVTTLGGSHDSDNSKNNNAITVDDEDMPMDEMMDIRKDEGRQFYHRRTTSNQSSSTIQSQHLHNNVSLDESWSATYQSVTPTKEVSDIVNMSPKCYADSSRTGMARMIAALNEGSTSRPPKLSREECMLWDALQTAMVNDRNEHLTKRRNLELSLQESNILLGQLASRETDLQSSLAEAQKELASVRQRYDAALVKNGASARMSMNSARSKEQQQLEGGDHESTSNEGESEKAVSSSIQGKVESLEKKIQEQDSLLMQLRAEHHAEVRAIQRVLADVTTEKAHLEERLDKQLQAKEASQNEAKTNEDSLFETADKDRSNNDDSQQAVTVDLASIAGDNSGNLTEAIEKLKDALRLAEQEKQTAKREAEKKARRLLVLERDIKVNKVQYNSVFEEKNALASEAASAKLEAEGQRNEIEILKAQIKDLERDLVAQKKRNDLLHAEIRSLKKTRDEAIKEAEVATSAANAAKEAAKAAKDAVMIATHDDKPKLFKSRGEIAISDEGGNHHTQPAMSEEEIETLQRNLADTTASLENAKKIIASLENANGALALDLRAKLKAKEEELSISQKEADERKRRLDSLATELRDLQRKQGDIEEADKRTKSQVVKQKALMGHLESSLSDLQTAVSIHEASTESSGIAVPGMDEISEILGDTLYAIKVTLEATEQYVDDVDDASVVNTDMELSSEVGRHIDAIVRTDREAAAVDLRHELDQKKVAVKRLEEALKKQNDEMKKLRSQYEARGRGNGGDGNEQLRAEIQNLRQQCSTNMEVLAKKERELSVLRSSLKVDDDDAGYISDDGSDDEDNDEEGERSMSTAKLNEYGPADAEALATILSQTSGSIDITGRARELEYLKKELLKAISDKESAAKELQAERESLANAKMIISSLEKANKGMMEDLRSRLQESNTAIATLLDKSMEHEKNADLLKEEIEKLKQQRLEEQESHAAEVARLKERIIISPGRAEHDLTSVRSDVTSNDTPSEEKKEDVDSPDGP